MWRNKQASFSHIQRSVRSLPPHSADVTVTTSRCFAAQRAHTRQALQSPTNRNDTAFKTQTGGVELTEVLNFEFRRQNAGKISTKKSVTSWKWKLRKSHPPVECEIRRKSDGNAVKTERNIGANSSSLMLPFLPWWQLRSRFDMCTSKNDKHSKKERQQRLWIAGPQQDTHA